MRWGLAEPEPNRIARDAAEVILSGLSYSHRAGTARLACEQVFDARTCRDMDWIAGKTGTPTFPNDERSLDELARLCARRRRQRATSDRSACGPLRPYKWYVAAYRTDPDDRALDQGHRRADRAQLAGGHGPHPRRRRSRPQSRRRDRHADRRAPRGPRCRETPDEAARRRQRHGARRADCADARVEAPLVWTFDGPFATCLSDMEDTLRRAIVQVGDVSRIAVQIDLSLPALKPRVDAGDAIQPAWGQFVERLSQRYGLPAGAARAASARRRAHWRRW